MRILDQRYNAIREELLNMMTLVKTQLDTSFDVFINPDIIKARQIVKNELKVDRYELKINKECEKFIVSCAPVADDLRRIMEINNILPSIERIGDNCEKIARFIKKYPEEIHVDLQTQLELKHLFFELTYMYDTVLESFKDESTLKLRDVFARDKEVNRINKQAKAILLDHIGLDKNVNEKLINMLLLLSQLERMGDYMKAIAEEIYFGVEGIFMRHNH